MLAESYKLLEATSVVVESLTEQLTRADSEKAESANFFSKVCQKPEQRMLRLSVAHADRKRSEKLGQSMVTEYVYAVDAVV